MAIEVFNSSVIEPPAETADYVQNWQGDLLPYVDQDASEVGNLLDHNRTPTQMIDTQIFNFPDDSRVIGGPYDPNVDGSLWTVRSSPQREGPGSIVHRFKCPKHVNNGTNRARVFTRVGQGGQWLTEYQGTSTLLYDQDYWWGTSVYLDGNNWPPASDWMVWGFPAWQADGGLGGGFVHLLFTGTVGGKVGIGNRFQAVPGESTAPVWSDGVQASSPRWIADLDCWWDVVVHCRLSNSSNGRYEMWLRNYTQGEPYLKLRDYTGVLAHPSAPPGEVPGQDGLAYLINLGIYGAVETTAPRVFQQYISTFRGHSPNDGGDYFSVVEPRVVTTSTAPPPDYIQDWEFARSYAGVYPSASAGYAIEAESDLDLNFPRDEGGFDPALYPYQKTFVTSPARRAGELTLRIENNQLDLDPGASKARVEIQYGLKTPITPSKGSGDWQYSLDLDQDYWVGVPIYIPSYYPTTSDPDSFWMIPLQLPVATDGSGAVTFMQISPRSGDGVRCRFFGDEAGSAFYNGPTPATYNMKTDRWYDIVCHVRMSRTDGQLEIWMTDTTQSYTEKVINFSGGQLMGGFGGNGYAQTGSDRLHFNLGLYGGQNNAHALTYVAYFGTVRGYAAPDDGDYSDTVRPQ